MSSDFRRSFRRKQRRAKRIFIDIDHVLISIASFHKPICDSRKARIVSFFLTAERLKTLSRAFVARLMRFTSEQLGGEKFQDEGGENRGKLGCERARTDVRCKTELFSLSSAIRKFCVTQRDHRAICDRRTFGCIALQVYVVRFTTGKRDSVNRRKKKNKENDTQNDLIDTPTCEYHSRCS